ncbi:PDZ domain-containing protein 2, partial [Clarias magur]
GWLPCIHCQEVAGRPSQRWGFSVLGGLGGLWSGGEELDSGPGCSGSGAGRGPPSTT